MKKRGKLLIALGAIALTAAVGGTWAYWTQELWAVNEFETGKYDTELHETFEPPKPGEWVPGVAVQKEVKVINHGNVDAVITSHINQLWKRVEDVKDEQGNPIDPLAGEHYHLMFPVDTERPETSEKEYAAVINWGDVAVLDNPENDPKLAKIGLEMGIKETVTGFQDAKAADKWILISAKEDEWGYSDLYFIYAGVVPGNEQSTAYLLKSVTLNPKVENTITKKVQEHWYDKELGVASSSNWYTFSEYGYDSARYTMNIDAYTVQATQSAMRELWPGQPGGVGNHCEAFISAFQDQLIPEYVDVTKE